MNEIIITNHVYIRAKERCGLKHKSLDRIALKAFNNGKVHNDYKGRAKSYLDKVYLMYENINNMRIYGEYIFLFNYNVLITVYLIPRNILRLFM